MNGADLTVPEPHRESIDTVIVGAGPAGLAVAACLSKRGVPHVVLERERAVGWSWRHHYERLHLHTAKRHSALPHLPFPRDYPCYPSRQQVVEYLEGYAAEFAIAPRLNEPVVSARRHGAGWESTTPRAVYSSRCLVVATSYNQEPLRPTWPGQESFAGEIIHSAEYRNPVLFKGKRVLVVGAGNSGAEIALDLCEHDVDTSLCVRNPVTVTTRDFFGGAMPVQLAGILMRRLPSVVADALSKPLIRLHIGDTSKLGFGRPRVGPFSTAKLGRIPLIDVGTLAMIRAGRLAVVPGIAAFDRQGVLLEGGLRRDIDVVILATGFRCRLGEFLEGAEGVADERGYPRAFGRPCELPGLFFVGYANPVSGALREIAIEAKRVARRVARGHISSGGSGRGTFNPTA